MKNIGYNLIGNKINNIIGMVIKWLQGIKHIILNITYRQIVGKKIRKKITNL